MATPDTLAPVSITTRNAWVEVLDGEQTNDTVLTSSHYDAVEVGIAASGDPAGFVRLFPDRFNAPLVIEAGSRALVRVPNPGGETDTVFIYRQPKTPQS